MNSFFFKILLLTVTLSSWFSVYGQDFEGYILYKTEVLNPNPKMIPDSIWQKSMKDIFGNQNYFLQNYYYKKDRYLSVIETGNDKGFQAYNPKDKLIYSWKINSDTVKTVSSESYIDEVTEIIDSELTDTIMNIPCKKIIINSKLGQTTIWYNSDYFKVDDKYFNNHLYGNWIQILQKTRCLPLKMEQKSFMTHTVQTALEYKKTPLKDELFNIPEFKEVIKSPF